MIIKDYITLLRPFGDKIRDFVFMPFDAVNYAAKQAVVMLQSRRFSEVRDTYT